MKREQSASKQFDWKTWSNDLTAIAESFFEAGLTQKEVVAKLQEPGLDIPLPSQEMAERIVFGLAVDPYDMGPVLKAKKANKANKGELIYI